MKRNQRLIKEILLATKNKDPKEPWVDVRVAGYSQNETNEQVRLLHTDGHIQAFHSSSNDHSEWLPQLLEPTGYNYLNDLCEPWYKKGAQHFLDALGKTLWMLVGGIVTPFVGVLTNSLFNIYK